MSFLKNVFKKKPGGTMFGNLIRGAVKASPLGQFGFGSGAGVISQEAYDLKNLSDADYESKYGKRKNGEFLPSVVPNPNIKTVEQQVDEANGSTPKKIVKSALKENLKKYWWAIAIPGGLIIGLIVWAARRGKGVRRRR